MDREKLFYRIKNMDKRLNGLAGIVQNAGPRIPHRHLMEWNKEFEQFLDDMDEIRVSTLEYLLEEEE